MQGFCKLKCNNRPRLFSYELEEGEENVIILPKQLAKELGIFIGDKILLEKFERGSAFYNVDVLYLRLVEHNLKTIELQKSLKLIKEKFLESTLPLNSGYEYSFAYE
jgi:hypothetical protein